MKMDNWRGWKGENYKHDVRRPRSYNKKRLPLDSWQQEETVPSWEKQFCSLIGSVSWSKLLDVKKYIHLYQNVRSWNDSAGKEAFDNAKHRFWAEINGIPCDISLPDPDIYIDEINWNLDIDPELFLDLERAHIISKQQLSEGSVLGDSLQLNQPIPIVRNGWDVEDQGKTTNWLPRIIDCDKNVSNSDNPCVSSCNKTSTENGWGKCLNDSWGTNKWENNIYDSENFHGGRTDRVSGTWDWNRRNGEVDGWHMSTYRTSRLHGDDYQMDGGRRNGEWRKTTNRVNRNRKPFSKHWKMVNSSQPLNHESGRKRHSWNWERPIMASKRLRDVVVADKF